MTHVSDPWIICRGFGSAKMFCVNSHGAQLVNAKRASKAPGALAAIEHRPFRIEHDPQAQSPQHRKHKNKARERYTNIQKALHFHSRSEPALSASDVIGPLFTLAGRPGPVHNPTSVPNP